METGRKKAKDEGKKTEVYSSCEEHEVWWENLYMKGSAARGSLFYNNENSELGPYSEDDIKFSIQNVRQFVNTVMETYQLEEDEKEDIRREILKLKPKAKDAAFKESSEAKYEEEEEELNVEEEDIENVFNPSFLISLMDRTDKTHVGDYILKSVSICSALSKNLTGMPINLWSIGTSGVGKTHNFQTIFKTIPEEYKVKFNSCSPKALYYFTKKYNPEILDGKVVLFNEAEASEEAIQVLRSITDPSEEKINLLSVMDQQSLEINIKGSPITWFTSVDPLEDDQLKNRFLFSNPDEGSGHHKDVAEHQQENIRQGNLQPIKMNDFPQLKAAYRKIIEETKDLDIFVPFEWKWHRTNDLRLQPYFGNLLHIIAKIHFRERPIIDNTLIVTFEDYYLTKFIWNQIEEITLDKVKEKDLKLLEKIPKNSKVTRSDLQEEMNWGYSTIKRSTDSLADAGLIRKEKVENAWKYEKVKQGLPKVAIELKEEYKSVKTILNELEENFKVAKKNSNLKGVAEKVTHPTPSKYKGLMARKKFEAKDIKKILEREEDIKTLMVISGNLNNKNKDLREAEGNPGNNDNKIPEDLLEKVNKNSEREFRILQEDKKCCNHSDRKAIVEVKDEYGEGWAGLCSECWTEEVNRARGIRKIEEEERTCEEGNHKAVIGYEAYDGEDWIKVCDVHKDKYQNFGSLDD